MKDGKKFLIGYQCVGTNMVFDIDTEILRENTRLVVIDAQTLITCEPVFNRYITFICIMVYGLNGLEVKFSDIMIPYLVNPVNDKVWTIMGPESGEDEVNMSYIVNYFYRLKSSS